MHEIILSGYTARSTGQLTLGTADSYGIEQLRITAGAGWEGLVIAATFHPPCGSVVQVLVPEDGIVAVPPEATCGNPARRGSIVFTGTAEGVQRISCNVAYILLPHAEAGGPESTATPSMDAQVLAEVAAAREEMEQLRRDGVQGGTQADLNAAEGEPGHVLNRTHWVEVGMVEVPIEGQWIEEEPGSWVFMKTAPIGLDVGKTYTVCWDGVEYECVAQQIEMGNDAGAACCVLGDADSLTTGEATAGAPPFVLVEFPEVIAAEIGVNVMATGTDSAQHDFTIHTVGEIVHKLDNKYLDLEWLPVGEWSKGDEVVAERTQTSPYVVTGAFHFIDSAPYNLSAGSRYFVIYNGAEHLLQLTPSEDTNVYGIFECNAFRALYLYDDSEGVAPYTLCVYTKDGSTSVTLAIHKAVNANTLPAEFLPQMPKLTFTGAVSAEYDGSEAVTVEIPEGGSSGGDYVHTPATAEVGQTIVVKAVDSNGKPTEWECADVPEVVSDDHINALINTALGVIENGTY